MDAVPSTFVLTVDGDTTAPGDAMNETGTPESGFPPSSRKITRKGELSTAPGKPDCLSPDAMPSVSLASAAARIAYVVLALAAPAMSTAVTVTVREGALVGTKISQLYAPESERT